MTTMTALRPTDRPCGTTDGGLAAGETVGRAVGVRSGPYPPDR